jgi:hypothetical protein
VLCLLFQRSCVHARCSSKRALGTPGERLYELVDAKVVYSKRIRSYHGSCIHRREDIVGVVQAERLDYREW